MSQKIITYIRDIPIDICHMITHYIIILSIQRNEMFNKNVIQKNIIKWSNISVLN